MRKPWLLLAALALTSPAWALKTYVVHSSSDGIATHITVQSAVTAAAAYQLGTLCEPVIIYIQANTVFSENVVLPAKSGASCQQYISLVSENAHYLNPKARVSAADQANLAIIRRIDGTHCILSSQTHGADTFNGTSGTVRCPGGPGLDSVCDNTTPRNSSYWRFYGIKFDSTVDSSNIYAIRLTKCDSVSTTGDREMILNDHYIFDHIWIAGTPNKTMAFGMGAEGRNIQILNSLMTDVHDNIQESKGILGLNLYNFQMINTQIEAFSMPVLIGGAANAPRTTHHTFDFKGNYFTRDPAWYYKQSTKTPTFACETGSYYERTGWTKTTGGGGLTSLVVTSATSATINFTSRAWPVVGVSVTISGTGQAGVDGTRVIATAGTSPAISTMANTGSFTVTVTGATTATYSTGITVSTTLANQMYKCVGGSWATSSDTPVRYALGPKNGWECKSCAHVLLEGNVTDKVWQQYFNEGYSSVGYMMNEVDYGIATAMQPFMKNTAGLQISAAPIHNVNIRYNIADKTNSLLLTSNLAQPVFFSNRGPWDLTFHDNLGSNLMWDPLTHWEDGSYDLDNTWYHIGIGRGWNAKVLHNTAVIDPVFAAAAAAPGANVYTLTPAATGEFFQTNIAPNAQFIQRVYFLDNIVSGSTVGWGKDTFAGSMLKGMVINLFPDGGSAMVCDTYLFEAGPTIAPRYPGDFGSNGVGSLNGQFPRCAGGLSGTSITSVATKLYSGATALSTLMNSDYTVKAANTDTYRAGFDGADRGADIPKVTWATQGAKLGLRNPWFDFNIRRIAPGSTTATVTAIAPNKTACTLKVAPTRIYTSPTFSDSVTPTTSRAISFSVTGLSANTRYWAQLTCTADFNSVSTAMNKEEQFITNP